MGRISLMLGALVFLSGAEASSQTLPATLAQEAARHGCRPLGTDYYERPGPVYPPYVYDIFPSEWKDESAAFWCEASEGTARYKLVFVNNTGTQVDCPPAIPWDQLPRGLGIFDEEKVSLDGFRYVADPARQVAPGQFTAYPPLEDTYDGAGALYYCLAGEWVFQMRH